MTVSRLYVVLSPHKAVVNKVGQELATHSLQCIPNLQGWWCLRWGGSMGRKQEKGKGSRNWFKITITIIFNICWLYTICGVSYAIISFNSYNSPIFAHFTDEEMRPLVEKELSNTAQQVVVWVSYCCITNNHSDLRLGSSLADLAWAQLGVDLGLVQVCTVCFSSWDHLAPQYIFPWQWQEDEKASLQAHFKPLLVWQLANILLAKTSYMTQPIIKRMY